MSDASFRPLLIALASFEAAGRLGSFSAAADELRLTQPAVSQQMSGLEAELGVSLFRRLHRGVTLTQAGQTLYDAAAKALDLIDVAASAIRRDPARRRLVVFTDFAFAALWLMPRLPALEDHLPGVEVRILTAQSVVDLRGEDVDVAILFGDGRGRFFPSGWETSLLFGEEVTPIGSPMLLKDAKPPVAPDQIAQMRRLHLQGGRDCWFTWADWMKAHGVVENPGAPPQAQDLSFGNYPLILQAVMQGQGIALGWSPLVDDGLRAGWLVRLTEQSLTSDRGYVIAVPTLRNPVGRRFRDWVFAERDRGEMAMNGRSCAEPEGVFQPRG
ncbi:putative choline sulfate-utilization transcription factor [Rhodopseudomonas rhenobacensis]|uniref:Putative choline sulfate-utilization transcription factor n=1 Tax=Rhodopseudomonas rhenobacensis TaxID=87461 RepID=A0A7W7Z337_9BRAD|nr:LysR substrate-binding domain-containing protein [Rhodopseudomonas rhenobacensis]MBB5046905.1 putative choline sulfate-utilization transcription factor [Rhodopseudomonas rhenobacensis]